VAVSESDIIAADQQIKQAEAALAAARSKQQSILSNPDMRVQVQQGESARQEVQAAKDALAEANRNYQRINSTYNAQQRANPPQKPATELQQTQEAQTKARIAQIQDEQAQKDRNEKDPTVGARVTDQQAEVIRRNRAIQTQGRAPRNDSPVQQQQAATQAAAQVEVGRHNIATEGHGLLETQVQAQTAAVNAGRGVLSDVMQQETANMHSAQAAQETARSAAQGLLSADVTMRGQDQSHIQARASFMSGIFNSIMAHGMQMMHGLPKGDQTAVKWVKAAFGMMNDMYHQVGLDRELPRPNPNSPAIRALETLSNTASSSVPRTPSAEYQATKSAILSAAIGNPPPNWNGPIGADAYPLLNDLDAARAAQNLPPVGNHGPVPTPTAPTRPAAPGTRPAAPAPPPPVDDPGARRQAAGRTPQGQKIVQQFITPDIQALATKESQDKNSMTPDEQQRLDDARTKLGSALDQINPPKPQPAQPAPTPPPPSTPGTPPQTPPITPPSTTPQATTQPDPAKDLSYDAMQRQVEDERKARQERGQQVEPDYSTAQETMDRLVNGEKPLVTAYNNEQDATIGNSFNWGQYKPQATEPTAEPTTPQYKLAGPILSEDILAGNELNKPAYTPQPFIPPQLETPNLMTPPQEYASPPPIDPVGSSYTPQFQLPESFLQPQAQQQPQQDPTPIFDPALISPNYSEAPTYDPIYQDPTYFVPPEMSQPDPIYTEPVQQEMPTEWQMPDYSDYTDYSGE
jgi:hypothetical protein